MQQCQPAVSPQRPAATAGSSSASVTAAIATERLPFTIRRVETESDLRKAVAIRYHAYARHIPSFAQSLREPEAADYDDDAVVLLAESKLDGSALGSTRIRTNLHQRLGVEESIVLPAWLQGRRLAEVTRLGIDEGRIGRMVKTALLKACVTYCQQNAIEWALATGRAPVDRQYEQLLFVDLWADKKPVPLKHVGNIPHRVMAFDITTIEQRWTEARHPLLGFFCHTHHPDIQIAQTAPARSLRMTRRAPEQMHLHLSELAIA